MSELQSVVRTKERNMAQDLLRNHNYFYVVSTAIEIGLFTWLEREKQCTREEANEAFGLDGQFTGSFLQALVDYELLASDEKLFRNSEEATDFFVKNSANYQGDLILNARDKNAKWRHLTSVLKGEQYPQQKMDESYIKAQHQFSLSEQISLVKQIKQWDGFSSAKSVLDVSNPYGTYAISLCESNRQLKGEVLCPIEQINNTDKLINYHNLDSRVHVKGVSLKELIEGETNQKFDIVILSHILYSYRSELLPTFKQVAKLVNTNGLLISNHWFCSPGCGGNDSGFDDLNKSVSIGGHPLCHEERYKTFFDQSGFKIMTDTSIPSMCGDSILHIGVKTNEKSKSVSEHSECC